MESERDTSATEERRGEAIEQIYKLPFSVTKDIKLSIFQFKIVHKFLPTIATLFRDGLKEHDLCHLCNDRQTLTHLFVTCPNVQIFWASFIQCWNNKNSNVATLAKDQILNGVIN